MGMTLGWGRTCERRNDATMTSRNVSRHWAEVVTDAMSSKLTGTLTDVMSKTKAVSSMTGGATLRAATTKREGAMIRTETTSGGASWSAIGSETG
jgi:hypothetical protein